MILVTSPMTFPRRPQGLKLHWNSCSAAAQFLFIRIFECPQGQFDFQNRPRLNWSRVSPTAFFSPCTQARRTPGELILRKIAQFVFLVRAFEQELLVTLGQ